MTVSARPNPTRYLFDSTDSVRVAAFDYGGPGSTPAAPTLVLTHATGFHARYWDPIATRLAEDFRIVSIDLRAHGDSVVPEGLELHWRGMADDVLAVIDGLELGSGLMCAGHSMGGCALMLAEQGRPGTFAAAWLMEPIIFDATLHAGDGPSPLVEASRRRREVFDSRDDVFERYMSRPPFGHCDPDMIRAYVDHGFRDLDDGSVQLKCSGESEAQVFLHSYTDAFAGLAEVATRTVVVGSGDGNKPAQFASDIAHALPNGTYEHFGELSHFAPLEDPERTAQSIRSALIGESRSTS